MNNDYLDYKLTLNLLKRLNGFVERDPLFSQMFLYRGYNLWQSYQQFLFGDILGWSDGREVEKVVPVSSLASVLKTLFLATFTVFFSLVSTLLLIIRRSKMLVFTMDKTTGSFRNDFRLQPLYEALNETASSYMELVHTVIGRDMLKNLVHRRRPVIYLEVADFLSFASVLLSKFRLKRYIQSLDVSVFKEQERELVLALLMKYGSSVAISRFRVSYFRAVFHLSAVEEIFSIDDVRTISEVVIAAELSGIRFYSIQHGHFTKYHVGWLKMTKLPGKDVAPHKILVWSEYWKKELLRLGTYFSPDQIVIGGETRLLLPVPTKSDGKKISVLIPYEKNAPKFEVLGYIKKLVEWGNVEVVFKLRPDQTAEEQVGEYGLLPMVKKIKLVTNTESAINSSDVVIGTYSTMLYEAVKLKRPVAILETSIDYGDDMIQNGLADSLSAGNFVPELQKISKIGYDVLEQRCEKLLGKQKRYMKDSLVALL